MEDYIPILIVAAAMVIKLFSSGKKNQSQHPAENFPELPELSDLFPDLVPPPETKQQEERKAMPVFEPLGAAPSVEGGRTTDSERTLEHLRKKTTSDKVPKEEPAGVEILEGFDIRKAIIYNEILQPKYIE
ncbi:MAG: hypothetical protein LBT49_03045 [Prevotellaceae bacterium]|jgi:hypothetical protein|nr:hypothetical protein [Prevotellaceae bacterium]